MRPAIIVAGAGGAALVATDRRTTGAQVDDEGIELKIANQVNAQYGDRVHVNVTSYNGVVLLTGEVPIRACGRASATSPRAPRRCAVVQNELVVAPLTDLSQRTNDTYITSKVKTRFIEANKFPPNAVKVVTERGVVYLMGIVTRPKATRGRNRRHDRRRGEGRQGLRIPGLEASAGARDVRPAPRSRRAPTRWRASRACRARWS